jgi:hypothetical protein
MQMFSVTVGVHHGGEEHQPRDMLPLITAPLSSPVFIASKEDNE